MSNINERVDFAIDRLLPFASDFEFLLVGKLCCLGSPLILRVRDALAVQDKFIQCFGSINPLIFSLILLQICESIQVQEEKWICRLLKHCAVDSFYFLLHLFDGILGSIMTSSQPEVIRVMIRWGAARVTTGGWILISPPLLGLT